MEKLEIFYTVPARFDMAQHSYLKIESAILFAEEMKREFISQISAGELDETFSNQEYHEEQYFYGTSKDGENFLEIRIIPSTFSDEKIKTYVIPGISQSQLLSANTLPCCDVCESIMTEGYYDEINGNYYCKKECIEGVLSFEEIEAAINEGGLFHTTWHDCDVFCIYDNQYARYKDSLFVQNEHGNCNEPIKIKKLNLNEPIYYIYAGEQFEV